MELCAENKDTHSSHTYKSLHHCSAKRAKDGSPSGSRESGSGCTLAGGFERCLANMATHPQTRETYVWSKEALEMAAQAKGMSGQKLEQLVTRIQRHSGRSKESCWRLIIQYGIKGRLDYRRWTDPEFDVVREELVRGTVDEVAKKVNRTPKAIRNILRRNHLSLREIRCDLFSVESLAAALRVRKAEVVFWIEQNWLQASVVHRGKRHSYTISPEALKDLYKHHHRDLMKRGLRNLALFEAYVEYCFAPKHTVGEQLLAVRRDKRERVAFAAATGETVASDKEGEDSDENDEDDEDCYRVEMAEVDGSAREPWDQDL